MQTLLDLIAALPRLGNRRAAGFAADHGVRWWTYRELHEMAHRAARILAARGIVRGQRIVLHGPNCPEWVAFFLGAALRGIVVVPVDANETTARLIEIARLTNAVFLIDVRRNPLIGIPRHDLHDLSGAGAGGDAGRAAVQPSDTAAILFTSGSTGAPRGVVLSHANLLRQAAPFLRFRAPLRLLRFRLLALSPLSHVQGLVVGLLLPFALGLIVLYTHSAEPRHLIRTIRTSRIRFLNAVPRLLDLLERELRTEIGEGGFRRMAQVMGRRFRVILAGGAALPAEREAFWRRSRVAVVQGYGLTETSAIATINVPFLGRAGSIGFAVHRGSIRLAPDGEVLVRGPHVASAFIGDVAGAFTDEGELRTGDLATRDGRNRFFFVGRKKDAIVTAEGHTVHPAALESSLLAASEVRDAVVLPVHRDGLEEIHAVLLLDPGSDAAGIVQRTNVRLAPHERIRSWTVWPEEDFPRGVLGKADRAGIARRISIAPAPLPPGPPPSLLLATRDPDPRRRVEALAAWLAAHRDAPVAGTLRDAGVDSIEVLQVLTRLEEAKRVAIEDPVEDVDAPEWPVAEALAPVRWLVRRAIVDPVLAVTTRVGVEGAGHLADVGVRSFLALDGDTRLDRVDFLRVYSAVPPRLRRGLMFLLASQHLRGEDRPLWFRIYMQSVLRFAMPVFIPYALFPKRSEAGTADALRRACVCIDRGLTPLTTWGRGTAVMATECRLTVVPVRLRDDGGGRVTVRFLPPIAPHPTRTSDELHELTLRAFRQDAGG
jgi:long-chain acyl-CoA synthetase